MSSNRRHTFLVANERLFDSVALADDDRHVNNNLLDDADDTAAGDVSASGNSDDDLNSSSNSDVLDAERLEDVEKESDDSDSDNEEAGNNGLVSPSGVVWSRDSSDVGRQPRRNIFRAHSGIKRGINPATALDCFLIFMEDAMQDCLRFTNLYGRRMVHRFNARSGGRKVWKPVTYDELCAFIGLHIIAGATKRNIAL